MLLNNMLLYSNGFDTSLKTQTFFSSVPGEQHLIGIKSLRALRKM